MHATHHLTEKRCFQNIVLCATGLKITHYSSIEQHILLRDNNKL